MDLLTELVEGEMGCDFVLVFANPFNMPKLGYECSSFTDSFSHAEAVAYIEEFFRVQTEGSILEEVLQTLPEYADEHADDGVVCYSQSRLLQLVLRGLLKVLQEHLMMDVHMQVSRDGDELLLKLTVAEPNLKVQADLTDYTLQLKQDWEVTHAFKEVAPYGAYERPASQKRRLFEVAGVRKNAEDYFQKYTYFSSEPSDEGSLFMQIDRTRLVYSMLLSTFEMSKFQSSGLLTNAFPPHNKEQLRRLAQSLEEYARIAELVKDAPGVALSGGLATCFGCTIAGPVDPATVYRLVERLLEIGTDRIGIADTVGYANPRQVAEMFAEVLDGRNSYLTDGVQRALSREPRDFADWAKETAATGVWDHAEVAS